MIKLTKTRFILCLAGAFMVGALIFGGLGAFFLNCGTSALSGNAKLAEIQKKIDEYYLFDYDKDELLDGLYKGYVGALNDPYSSYMNSEEYESYLTTTQGEYSGVGITFSMLDGKYCVVSVSEDSPAEEAGVKEGDIILLVDGQFYEDNDLMAAKIRGKAGSTVTLTMMSGKEKKEVTMTRREIKQKSISYEMIEDEMAYIEISQFSANTADDFNNALNAVTRKGAKSLILDLRNNGGGLVEQSVKIADQFLDKGVVCYIRDKDKNTDSYDAEDGKTKLKTVVLMNENSASSSEILAAALKDNGYDTVGTRTFGKGIIQTTLELKDGSVLKLTVMEYLSPDMHKIHEKGIKPEYKVKDNPKTKADEQLDKAKELLK